MFYPRNSSLVPLPKFEQERFILRCFLIIFRFQFCLWVSRYNEKNESTPVEGLQAAALGVRHPTQMRLLDLRRLRWLILLLASSFPQGIMEDLKKQNNLSTVTKAGKGLGQTLTPGGRSHKPEFTLSPLGTGKQLCSPGLPAWMRLVRSA